MDYQYIEQSLKEDHLANALYAREVEYFHYDFDRINFEYLLKITTDQAAKKDIENRLASTRQQMQMVSNVYEALKSQITDQADHAAAVERVTAKRKLEESKK